MRNNEWLITGVMWPLIGASTVIAADRSPAWSSDRRHRLIVRVEAMPDLARPSDEMVARAHIDFSEYLKKERTDLGSLQIVGISPETGQPLDFESNRYASTRGDRPLRFYDDAIPWDYQEHEGYAQSTQGQGTPIRKLPGGARFFNSLGDGKRGQLAWVHTQTGQQPAEYAIYFDTLAPGAPDRLAPTGFIGDGAERCTPVAHTFAPVLQGRVGIADLNGDGLFDLMIGNATGTVLWHANIGSPGKPHFGPARLLSTDDGPPGAIQPIDVGWSSGPVAMDWDHDGKLDLIVGAEKECCVYFHNVGDRTRPLFHLEGLVQADGKDLRIPKAPCRQDPENKIYQYDYNAVPEIVDWDGDGDLDLLVGGYITGRVWYYENVAATPQESPKLIFRGALQADGKDIDVTWMAAPTAADFDGDGDLDFVSGAMQMTAEGGDLDDPDLFLWYFENVGTRQSPKLAHRPFPAKGKFKYGAAGCPRAVDFNADGLSDLIVSVNGLLLMLPNLGTRGKPLFDASTPATTIAWGSAELGHNQLLDYDGDDWPDLFTALSMVDLNAGKEGLIPGPRVMQRAPMSVIQLNSGQASPAPFERTIEMIGAEKILHPSPSGDHWDCRTLADVDGDGLLDIVLGDHPGYVWFHRNIGSKDKPVIDVVGRKLETTQGQPIHVGLPPPDVAGFDILQGARTQVSAGDYNHDGKIDLVVCDTYGYIRLFTQVPGEKIFFAPAIEVGRFEKIRLTAQRIDWNGDGWDDILAAYASGHLSVLLNKRVPGEPAFEAPRPLEIPGCYGEPWPFVADWNHDGDDDLIIDQHGYTRFVERSFIDHGYRPARIVRYEKKDEATGVGRASEPMVIVTFGDSTTAPRGPVRIFAKLLEERLANRNPPGRVINAGIPGNNTRQAHDRLARDVIAHHPDFVTISFGINDSAIDVWKGDTEPRITLKEYEANLDWIVEQLQGNGIRPIIMTPNPVAWTDQLKKLYNKPPYHPDDPDGWNVLLKDYAQAARSVAKTHDVPLVDTYQIFKAYAAQPGHDLNDLMVDGMHPGDSGHAMIVDHLMEVIASVGVSKQTAPGTPQ